ncbi:MAG: hypothetical protein R2710_31475 [Acidimicrobiales bacterium]
MTKTQLSVVQPGELVVVGWWPVSRGGGGMIVSVDHRQSVHRHAGQRSPVRQRIGSRRLRVSIMYFSLGAGKRFRNGVDWSRDIQLEPGEGALVLVRCAVRWIPFGPVTPPEVTLQVGPDLTIPPPGRWRPGWGRDERV